MLKNPRIRGADSFYSAVVPTDEMTKPLTTTNHVDNRAATASRRAISLTDLWFTYYNGTTAVRGVSLDIRKGEFFGLLGPNGAGKTTLIKTLVTLLKPTTGHVTVNGVDAVEQPVAVRNSVGYTAQDTSVDPELTARENLQYACKMYRVPQVERADRIADLLQLVGLEDVADARADTFSGGMRKRLDIATSLVHRPPLVFLDEPTNGLDPAARLRLWEHLREINAQGTTVFLTTQYLEEADHLCNRLAVIADGELIARGSPAELKQQVGGDTLEITLQTTTPTDVARARRAVLESDHLGEDAHVGLTQDGLVISSPRTRQIGTKVLVALEERDLSVTQFNIRSPTLDDVFLTLTGETFDETHQEKATLSSTEHVNEEVNT
ncbi:ABC transporter ATP-binding protein [Halegenticoccus soli]|uniref:ABC transporter ATP-binding protein n=1 Tax=Halegenticoccus soli TaxID=1985678 RepID=UPI0018ED6DCE|nr:ATP-binding cassette domain-containing protein [Halegenticoccus soli]